MRTNTQRMAQCTRKGGPKQLRLERFQEALHDEQSGLTYPALTGRQKQSVQDAEILFSKGVEMFMGKKGTSMKKDLSEPSEIGDAHVMSKGLHHCADQSTITTF